MAVVGFRRTLVGLKQQRQGRQSDQRHLFQTDPCGIEADGVRGVHEDIERFRRTLVGLKRGRERGRDASARRFRRTLVGLKRGLAGSGGTGAGFRRTLVGLKQGLLADRHFEGLVSDGPLWD